MFRLDGFGQNVEAMAAFPGLLQQVDRGRLP